MNAPVVRVPLRRRLAASLCVLFVLALVVNFVLELVLRSRIEREAAKQKIELVVGTVDLGWFSVRLGQVSVLLHGAPCAHADIATAQIDLTSGFKVQRVSVQGADIAVEGEPDAIVTQLRAWRGDVGEKKTSSVGAGTIPVDVEGISARWITTDPAHPAFEANGIEVSRDSSGWRLALKDSTIRWGDRTVEGLGAEVTNLVLSRDHEGSKLSTSSASLTWKGVALSMTGLRAELGPAADLRTARAATLLAAYDPDEPSTPAPPPILTPRPARARFDLRLPLPRVRAVRSALAKVGALLAVRTETGSSLSVDRVSLRLGRDGARTTLGPAAFALTRRADDAHATFATAPGGPKLVVDGVLPLRGGDVRLSAVGESIALPVFGASPLDDSGGTISGEGRVVLAADGSALSFDGDLHARGLAVQHPSVAPQLIRGLNVDTSARGSVDSAQLRIDEATVGLGALLVRATGLVEQTPDRVVVNASMDIPKTDCEALLDSVPRALLPTLHTARMQGTFGAHGKVSLDTKRVGDLSLHYQVDDLCRLEDVPAELARERFLRPFSYRVYRPDGSVGQVRSGPGTDGWTALERISPHMQAATLQCEDPPFMRHHGFNHGVIREALVTDLDELRFKRGASTISMQLAKNLFLSRDKTIARKLEEAILTDYVEQAFRKDEILELYLNIVEFGPDIYGIARAADHYFGRTPAELNIAESFFLATVLPAPVLYHSMYEKNEVTLERLNHIHFLMTVGQASGKFSEAEITEALKQPIVFHRPGDPPPPRRPPARGLNRLGEDGWHPFWWARWEQPR